MMLPLVRASWALMIDVIWWVVIPGNPVGPTDHSSRQNASLFSTEEPVTYFSFTEVKKRFANRSGFLSENDRRPLPAHDQSQNSHLLYPRRNRYVVHRTTMVDGRRRPWQPPPPWRNPPAQNHGCHGNIWSDLAAPPTRTAWEGPWRERFGRIWRETTYS